MGTQYAEYGSGVWWVEGGRAYARLRGRFHDTVLSFRSEAEMRHRLRRLFSAGVMTGTTSAAMAI